MVCPACDSEGELALQKLGVLLSEMSAMLVVLGEPETPFRDVRLFLLQFRFIPVLGGSFLPCRRKCPAREIMGPQGATSEGYSRRIVRRI
jgi:hypothetical protein